MPTQVQGLGLVDDQGNKSIVVNLSNARQMTNAEYQQLTPAQRNGAIIVTDFPIPEDDDKVEVTADGDKTYAQLLTELKELIDKTKLQYYSEIVLDKQTSVEIHDIVYWDANVVATACVFTTYGGVTETDTFYIGNSVKYQKNIVGNVTDMSSEKPSNGTKITLYYGNKKATVDLQTTANRCWYDSNTNVKQKLDLKLQGFRTTVTIPAISAGQNGSITVPFTGDLPYSVSFIANQSGKCFVASNYWTDGTNLNVYVYSVQGTSGETALINVIY